MVAKRKLNETVRVVYCLILKRSEEPGLSTFSLYPLWFLIAVAICVDLGRIFAFGFAGTYRSASASHAEYGLRPSPPCSGIRALIQCLASSWSTKHVCQCLDYKMGCRWTICTQRIPHEHLHVIQSRCSPNSSRTSFHCDISHTTWEIPIDSATTSSRYNLKYIFTICSALFHDRHLASLKTDTRTRRRTLHLISNMDGNTTANKRL
ncbi:hypothetical protein K474DRAFT_740269 [Panus rudis PR-1116 ss-1]|nr:hypothetical protein K474DRAFT_740269 [Panus rudis PR-1116 ss-1]